MKSLTQERARLKSRLKATNGVTKRVVRVHLALGIQVVAQVAVQVANADLQGDTAPLVMGRDPHHQDEVHHVAMHVAQGTVLCPHSVAQGTANVLKRSAKKIGDIANVSDNATKKKTDVAEKKIDSVVMKKKKSNSPAKSCVASAKSLTAKNRSYFGSSVSDNTWNAIVFSEKKMNLKGYVANKHYVSKKHVAQQNDLATFENLPLITTKEKETCPIQ